jgi:adenine specific DNA methylase Mod
MAKEQKFYNILQDLFVGAKLEGDSGYVNLMNIKTDYFNLIKKKIENEIRQKFGEDKPEDLYDKLYTFFDSYFSDGGAIFFSSTPSYKNIYAKVYSDREDVSLFWKTSKLYYVKSEANYRTIENLQLNSDSEIAYDFHFDASLLKHKQANEKKELQFYFIGTQKRTGKKVIKFRVIYKNDNKYEKLKEILDIKDNAKIIKHILENSEKLDKKITFKNGGLDLKIVTGKGGRDLVKVELLIQDNKDLLRGVTVEPGITDISDIEKYLRLKSIVLNSEDIEKAFKVYKKQTEIDYFIHKDAKGFLREQFDLYMYQHLTGNMETVFKQRDLERIKKIKEIAYLAIDYIGNFEDELKKIWLKPKFARKSNYVVTLDRLVDKTDGIEVIGKIINYKGMKEQIAEWQELGIVKEGFNQKEITRDGKLNKDFQTLPIDTKYFKDLEIEIIGLFDNLDEALDGRLIKSDNFQALNTLLPKYKGQVEIIYIDPPFNTGDDFEYIDRFQDSTWLTLMENRLELANLLIKNEGSFYLHLDNNANYRGRELLNRIFLKDNFVNEIAWSYRTGGASKKKSLPYKHDSILFYTKDIDNFILYPVQERQYYEKSFMGARQDENGRYYVDTMLRDVVEGVIEDHENKLSFNVRPVLNLSNEFFGFNTQKPEGLLYLLNYISLGKKRDLVMDFFAGSGVTLSVAQKVGNKWLGVEIGDHFYEFYDGFVSLKNSEKNKKDIYKKYVVLNINENEEKINASVLKVGILGRMKEVLASNGRHEPCGISGNIDWQGGGFFKYYELEQYEDALKKAVYNPTDQKLENIDFSLSEKQALTALEIDLKKEKAQFVFEKLYPDVDIPETISNLFGKKIKKITKDKVVFEDESEVDLNNLDFEKYEPLKKLIYW